MKTKVKVITAPAIPEVTEEREVEIQTPRYSKDMWGVFKITDKGIIRTKYYEALNTYDIEVCIGDYLLKEAYNAEECSEQEFLMAFNIAKAEIESQLNEELQTV